MYTEKTFSLASVQGLSQKQLEVHLKLYAGYVKNTNLLLELLERAKKDPAPQAPVIAELTRRFGFEFNGMRLHELYFAQLSGTGTLTESPLLSAIIKKWGSYEAWKSEVSTTALMRGIGWVLLVQDPENNELFLTWVSDHEYGHLGGLPIIMALDVWEHAFMVDYLPAQRADYVSAFFGNLSFETLSARYIS